jgi:hypothetical protein
VTEEQYINAVMEALFGRGVVCPRQTVAVIAANYWQSLGPSADPAICIETLSRIPNLIRPAMDPEKHIPWSPVGACEEWIAVHEAAHAIVAVKARIMIWGIRFYGDGLRGETGLEEHAWWESDDEDLLQRLVRVDVAGNVGERMRGHEPNGGYPSQFFPEGGLRKDIKYPTDIIQAWDHAMRVARVRFAKEEKEPTIVELHTAIRVITEQAEAEAEQILRENMRALEAITQGLRRGPMTGKEIRAIIERAI